MIHQQCNAGTTTRAHRQCHDNAATTWINPQTDAPRTTITSPFDTRWPTWKGEHLRSRQFHSAQKRQINPIRQPIRQGNRVNKQEARFRTEVSEIQATKGHREPKCTTSSEALSTFSVALGGFAFSVTSV
jgi:pyruvate/2-oxoglutarate dehydrogenase complex dihydrolipoamide acyltransferase (E2) component